MMNFSSLLLSGLTGAATGYITNDVAVRMLFRSFGPFGGVLESTREEFIFNISELVEDEIINYETIAGELENPRVRQEINRFVTEFISVQLYEQFSDTSWQEVPGWDESCASLAEMLSDHELITSILDDLAKNLKISEILSREQISHIIEQILRGSGKILQDDEVSKALSDLLIILFLSLYKAEAAKDETLAEIKNIQKNTADHRREIQEILQEIFENLKISPLLEQEMNNLLNKPLGSWWGAEDEEQSENSQEVDLNFSDLVELLQEFLQKPEGKELVEDIYTAAFSALQEVDLTLPELMDDNWEEVMLPLLRERLPELLEVLLDWIEENRQELEGIIDEAIEEVLTAGSGLRNQLKNIIFRALQGNIARRYGILNRVLKNLNSDEDKTRLAQELTGQLAEILENKTVGWFFYRFEQLEIVDWRLIHQLIVRLLSSAEVYGPGHESDVYSVVPADFFPAEEFSKKISSLLPEIFSDIAANLLLSQDFACVLNNIFHEFLHEYLNCGNASEDIQKFLEEFFPYLSSQKYVSRMAAGLTPAAVNHFSSRYLSNFLNPEVKKTTVNFLQSEIKNNIHQHICQQQDRGIDYLLDEIQSISDYQDKFTNFVLNILEDNLSLLLEDQISQAVSENLLDLSTEDMRQVVENFMGSELKPLTYFGGLLGFTAGILMETAGSGVLAAADGSGRLGISMLVYGLVGFVTNVTAINMIFRPYNSFNLGGFRIPFTPGLIARNQERFAAALGDFIENDLLNPHHMSRLLRENRSNLEKILVDTLLQDDYRRLRMILRVSSDDFARNIIEIIKSQFRKNPRKISEYMVENINEELSLPIVFGLGGKLVQKEMDNNSDNLNNTAAGLLARLQNIDRSYVRLLPGEIKRELSAGEQREKLLEKFAPGLRENSDLGAKLHIGERLQESDFKASGEELLSPVQQKKITELLAEGTLQFLQEGEFARVLNRIDREILQDSLPDQLLQIIPTLVQENLAAVFDIFLERILAFLSHQREEIKNMTAEIVEEELDKTAAEEGFVSNIILKGAYRFTDGRTTLEDLIDNLIDNKLPDYLQGSRNDIGNKMEPIVLKISRQISQELFYGSRPEKWANLLSSVAQKPEVDKNIRRFITRFSSLLWQVQFSPLKSLSLLEGYGESKRNNFRSELKKGYRENKAQIESSIFNLLSIPLTEAANRISPARSLELITGIQKPGAEKIEKRLDNNKREIHSAISAVISALDRSIKKEQRNCDELRESLLLQEDIFIDDITWWLRQLEDRSVLWEDLQVSISAYIERISALLPRVLEDDTVEFFAYRIGRGGMDSLELHFQSLLESVAVKATAVKQVEEMDPAAIEMLFKSFAGRYLNRLKMYGWSGSFFGLLAELINLMMPG